MMKKQSQSGGGQSASENLIVHGDLIDDTREPVAAEKSDDGRVRYVTNEPDDTTPTNKNMIKFNVIIK